MALRYYDPFGVSFYHPSSFVERMFDSFFDNNLRMRVRDNAGQMKIGEDGDFSYKVNVDEYKPDELKVDIEGEEIVIRVRFHDKLYPIPYFISHSSKF